MDRATGITDVLFAEYFFAGDSVGYKRYSELMQCGKHAISRHARDRGPTLAMAQVKGYEGRGRTRFQNRC